MIALDQSERASETCYAAQPKTRKRGSLSAAIAAAAAAAAGSGVTIEHQHPGLLSVTFGKVTHTAGEFPIPPAECLPQITLLLISTRKPDVIDIKKKKVNALLIKCFLCGLPKISSGE